MDHLEIMIRTLEECFGFDNIKDFFFYCDDISGIDINKWKYILNNGNKIFWGINNKNALRFECGDYSDSPCPSKEEATVFLKHAGINFKCYSIYPCIEYPQLIYADDFIPNEELKIRYFPRYNHPESVFETEEFLIDDLVSKGLFHEKANAYIFECSLLCDLSEVNHATVSADRYPDKAFITVIRNHSTVSKQALYPEGIYHLQQLRNNTAELKKQGVPMLDGKLEGSRYITPYINAPVAIKFLKNELKRDINSFIFLCDRLAEHILRSSAYTVDNEDEIILSRGYIDMVPLNAFFCNGDFLFFDQEFYIENCPAKAIIYRAILILYCGDEEVEKICPLMTMLQRYGLTERHEYWHHYTDEFFKSLRDQKTWSEIQEKHGSNNQVIVRNKKIHEMKQESNPFSEIHNKDVYVFGTGHFADKFFDMYHNDYRIVAAIDNDPEKQNMEWKGLPVYAPTILTDKKNVYVIICVKDYQPIYAQLTNLGINHIGIYDAHHIYPGRQLDNIPYRGKTFHIGYCAGVYDLFHIGHVNIFRRAKEQCDYLIVGVVTDEGVRNNKHTEPFIPYEERLEMVRSCRYVDEAVEIPYIYCRTPDMFEKYHFDVQFSGSDYEHDTGWLLMKQYLNDHGAEMVFFPYTECTSSTKIKNLIEKGLTDKI